MERNDWKLLKEIAELEKTPQGAYNIRRNGELDSRASTANIEITTKTEPGKSGIDIRIKPGTKRESVHIPVIITQTGFLHWRGLRCGHCGRLRHSQFGLRDRAA